MWACSGTLYFHSFSIVDAEPSFPNRATGVITLTGHGTHTEGYWVSSLTPNRTSTNLNGGAFLFLYIHTVSKPIQARTHPDLNINHLYIEGRL